MGSSYSDLNLYFKINKDDTYGFPKNGEPNNKNPKKYTVTVSKSNYQGCVNFEKVTHSIEFKPPDKGTNYNILLYDGDYNDDGKSKGKNVFGYYYPSNDNVVLKELHVYYSVLAPDSPLVVSFFTRGGHTHNFLYSGLLSTGWVRAYRIAYYSLGQKLSTEHLTKEFRKSHRNRKIKFVTEKSVKEVSGFKQELEKGNVYRYIYYPTGDASVLGSECISKINSEKHEPLKCTKSEDASNPAKATQPAQASNPSSSSAVSTATQPKSPPEYDNKIDPYYLTSVKDHYYDGVILYFVINGSQAQTPGTSGNDNSGRDVNNNQAGANSQPNGTKKDNYDHNMAVILELIDNCKPKTHLKRIDKLGNWWSQEKVEYNDDTNLIKQLKEFKQSAEKNESTTFILEMKAEYKGVSNVKPEKDKITYSKYTHTVTSTNIKTNLLFRKEVKQIGNLKTSNFKTKSLDIYFLKLNGKEEEWPFILMFTYQNEDKTAKPAEAPQTSNGAAGEQQQQQQQQPPQAQVASGGAASPSPSPESKKKECKKCYFSSENYTFDDWEELKNEENPKAEEKKTKTKEPEKDPGDELQKKLESKLAKIEDYGKCQTELYLLRKVAFYVLSTDEVDPEKIEEIKKEERPEVNVFVEKGTGTSLPVVLGSVAAGLVVLGTISAIIYGTSLESVGDGETCNQDTEEPCKNGGDKLILNVDGGYASANLEYVYVYFNQYDLNNPLLFVLQFKQNGDGPKVDNKYYKMSDFGNDKKDGKAISELPRYSDDSSILDALITANDTIVNLLTFDIGKKPANNKRNDQYNKDKIQLTDDSGSEPQLSDTGFKRYKHEPQSNHTSKKGCVIYNRDVLMGRDERPIDIQDKQYSAVNVYFGDKEKRSPKNGSTRDSGVPLLIELTKNGSAGSDPDYYVHKKDSSNSGTNVVKYYWESLSGDSDTLKHLLEDIGLYTNRGGRGYATLKLLLNGESLGNGDDLSDRLKKAKGTKLKGLLEQKVNDQKSLLVVLLERVEFNLVDSVVILIERKNDSGSYGDGDISYAVLKLEPSREINRITGKKMYVTNVTGTEGKCFQEYGYNLWEHNFSKYVQELKPPEQKWAGLRFLIPTANGGQCKELSLYDGSTGPENLVYKYYNTGGSNGSKVYVVFYGQDPRPLMLCYGTDAFVPKYKSSHDTEWVKVEGVTKCVCGDDNGQNEALLKALTEVVGFLNEVDLSKHPSGTTNGTSTECTSAENGNTCIYDVHKYGKNTVQISVKCVAVNVTPPGTSCYKKLIHTPAGINGEGNGDKFRLGNVVYENESKGKLDYTNGSSQQNKYKPLIQVSVYFYSEDTKYQDPLLVVLEFKNGTVTGASTVCECYKLTKTANGTDGKMTWEKEKEKDSDSCKKLVEENGDKLVKHLDCIRYDLKKVLKVELHKTSQYPAMGRASSITSVTGNGFSPLNGEKKVDVVECTETCSELTKNRYKCFKHEISSIDNFDYNLIAGVAFTIPGKNGQGVIEIKLFNGTTETNCQNGKQITPLVYNKCMGDVYVFFYDFGGSSGNPDTVPLMLWFNKCYYRPCNRESYFDKWVKVPGLSGKQGHPCESDGGASLAKQLDIVNKALNQIDLDPEKAKGTGYGLPETADSGIIPHPTQFPTIRVKLTRQEGPKQPSPPPSGTPAYVKIVHRTVNGYTIGALTSNGGKSELTTNGFCVKGTSEVAIKVKNCAKSNGDHTHKELVTQNEWNTVVAYYSTTDTNLKLPQLIVILKTEKPIEESGNKPVTSVKGTPYGYYILTNKGGAGSAVNSVNYEYVWHPVENGQTQVTLDDKTDFRLLNSVVILVDKRCNGEKTASYGESEIGPAITSANLSSPGQKNEINRITGKTINVTDGTKDTCLSGTGFKLITHDINALVTLEGQLGENLKAVTLIAGIRFLIPTGAGDKYRQLILSEINGGDNYLYYQNPNKTVYVYFYGEDPRPLLACYNGNAYKPIGKIFYCIWWDKDTKISKCICTERDCNNCNNLLGALVKVSNFLNPVDIFPICNWSLYYYKVHQFNGQDIKIHVKLEPATEKFCYNKYTHTHCGTSDCNNNGGTGFRLGTIYYGCNCIKENGTGGKNGCKCITSVLDNGNPYTPASKVVVFYYQGDTEFERPLLVALCQNSDSNTCNLYYELQNDASSSGAKLYNKGENGASIDVNETRSGGKLDSILGRILSDNSNHLQIIIDKLPMETLYCFKCENNGQTVDCKKNNNICDKSDYIY